MAPAFFYEDNRARRARLAAQHDELRPICLSADLPILSVSAHGFVDLVAIMPIFWRQLQHCAVNILVNRQHVIERLFRPFPPEIKSVFHRTILKAFAGLTRGVDTGFGRCRCSRPHDADPSDIRWPVMFGYEQQRLACHFSASCSAFGC